MKVYWSFMLRSLDRAVNIPPQIAPKKHWRCVRVCILVAHMKAYWSFMFVIGEVLRFVSAFSKT